MITAATLDREVLAPALDAQALNDRQQLTYFNASPERDSLVELFNDPQMPAPLAAEGLRLVTQGVAANQLERTQEQRISGFADQMVTATRRAERSGTAHGGLTAREIARFARTAPRLLELFAPRDIRDCYSILNAPAAQLLAPAVAHHIGDAAFERWQELVSVINERDAQAGNPGVASNPEASGGSPES